MPKRSSIRPKHSDVNILAASIVQQTVEPEVQVIAQEDAGGKNPAAVALGRLGGMKGGKARAAKLSKAKKVAIAKKAALARWSKKPKITS